MRLRIIFPCLAAAAFALALAGCTRTTDARTAAVATPKRVQLVAYINQSSGCQKDTEDFLQSLTVKHPEVGLEIVDFGDGGAGADRWHASGLTCMAININGSSLVKYTHKGKPKMVSFRAPAPLYWSHDDLAEAVQAALDGTLQPVTEKDFEDAPEMPAPPGAAPSRK